MNVTTTAMFALITTADAVVAGSAADAVVGGSVAGAAGDCVVPAGTLFG